MSGNSVIQIFNSSGNLLMRNDILAYTCTAAGEFPRCTKGAPPGLEFQDEWVCSWIDITRFTDPIVAVRPAPGAYATIVNTFLDGKVYAVCISGYNETPGFYIFERKAQRLSNYGLQLFHPETGEPTFDSCWDLMLPEKQVSVSWMETQSHGMNVTENPAFVPLNYRVCYWNQLPNGSRLSTQMGLSTTTTEVSSRACYITDQTYGSHQKPQDAILVNVDHLINIDPL